MSKNKFKRKQELKNKQFKKSTKQIEIERQSKIDEEIRQKELQEQRELFQKVLDAKVKYDAALKKNKEIDKKFKSTKKDQYDNKKDFISAYNNDKNRRKQIIDKLHIEYIKLKNEYNEKYEKGVFRFKRWFFGMGKEFNRTSWCNKKQLWISFFTVLLVMIVGGLLFLIVDLIFNATIFG